MPDIRKDSTDFNLLFVIGVEIHDDDAFDVIVTFYCHNIAFSDEIDVAAAQNAREFIRFDFLDAGFANQMNGLSDSGEIYRFFKSCIQIADDRDFFIAIEGAVASRAVRDAAIKKFLLAGNAQLLFNRSGRDDDDFRANHVLFGLHQKESVILFCDIDDASVFEFDIVFSGLFHKFIGEFRSADGLKARIVVDFTEFGQFPAEDIAVDGHDA